MLQNVMNSSLAYSVFVHMSCSANNAAVIFFFEQIVSMIIVTSDAVTLLYAPYFFHDIKFFEKRYSLNGKFMSSIYHSIVY
ncbi:hypothetical protein GUJ93_ZPchr0011g26947 [Zizania palustris]|uniref:Uncharacterized protein n=1 Tax=Zizania palustris TaxID=103762 RepID=A0A8J6BK24_ZIZPA|nr:hypothetical protein GUJ93_ZPchr0011g26947 [Zizania palustris]